VSVVWRLLSVGALALSGGVLLFSVAAARREQRIRPRLDLLRLAITLLTTGLMAGVLGVRTPEALMGAGLLGGLLVGLYEGLHVRVRFLGKQAFARRTVLGLAAWGAGVVVVQGAGVVGRIGVADFGLTMSFFGIGQIAGLLTGRWQSVVEARRARARSLATAALTLLALAAALVPHWGSAAKAAGGESDDLGGGDVQVTLRWSSLADLDLSVTDPAGDMVSFANPSVLSGGQLDRDANFPCSTATTSAVENVFWPPGGAPYGSYRVSVTYRTGCATDPAQSYQLTVLFGGEVVKQVNATIEPEEVVTIELPYAGGTELPGSEGSGTVAPVAAVDDDPDNRLSDCASNPAHRVGFGDTTEDRVRCFTFRYEVPPGGIESAVVYLSLAAPVGSLQETDSLAAAVGRAFPDQCGLAGQMPGCVTLHGGFRGGERSLTVDLLNLACDPGFGGTEDVQQAVRAQLDTGVLHMILQGDTTLYGARLALNEGPPALPCGTSTQPAPLNGPANRDAEVLSAGEGAGTAAVGLGGTGLLLVTALVGGGNPVTSLMGAWRTGRLRGLRDLAVGGPGDSGEVTWQDPALDLGRGRAAAVLEALPPDLRAAARQAVNARLEQEQTDRLVEVLRRSLARRGTETDPAGGLAADDRASALLSRLPPGVREHVVGKVIGGLRAERVRGAVEAAAGGEGLGPGVDVDAEVDLAAAVHGSGRVASVLAGLPEEMRAEATDRLVERLDAERLGRWVDKLREVAAPAVAAPGGSVLDGAEAQRVLAALPTGLRERVQEHAGGVLERELVGRLVARAKGAIERSRAVALLRGAFSAGDGDGADAVLKAVGSAPEITGDVGLEELVRRATGGGVEGLRSLPRSGGTVPPADLIGHLAGEDDLLAVVSPVEGVQEALGAAGPGLRPQVEGALLEALDAARVDWVVEEVTRGLGPAARAAADVMSVVRDLPGVRNFLGRLAGAARDRAYALLGERLRAQQVEEAVGEVSHAVALDRAEEALGAAARAGDLDAADRALEGLSADEAEAVSAAALGEA
jgi:hypothetical protein